MYLCSLRLFQTELYNQQKKQNEALLEESRHTAQQKTEVMFQLEAVDQTRKIHEVSSDNLREELKKAEVTNNTIYFMAKRI